MSKTAWPVDGRGRQAPTRQADAMSEQEFQDRIIEAVTSFAGGAPQTDDITLVVIKRDP